jgi:hypothetical protein
MPGIQVFVDPYIFALPSVESQEKYRIYFAELQSWLSFLINKEENYFTSRECIYSLIDKGKYPWLSKIKEIIARYAITEFTDVDLSNSLRKLSDSGPFVEDWAEIDSIISKLLEFEPSIILNRLEEETRSKLQDSFSMSVINQKEILPEVILTFGTTDIDNHIEYIILKTKIDLVQYSDGEIREIDEVFEINIPTIFKPIYLYEKNVEEILLDPPKAIKYVYLKHFCSKGVKEEPDIQIKIGPSFLKTIFDLGLKANYSLLYKIYLYALLALFNKLHKSKGAKLHPVRISRAADAPQIEKDGAKKWRCQLAKKGAGYRLHYWSYPDGSIELDAVLLESEID